MASQVSVLSFSPLTLEWSSINVICWTQQILCEALRIKKKYLRYWYVYWPPWALCPLQLYHFYWWVFSATASYCVYNWSDWSGSVGINEKNGFSLRINTDYYSEGTGCSGEVSYEGTVYILIWLLFVFWVPKILAIRLKAPCLAYVLTK